MPVYHFVFHSFGSWYPDHPDGYFDREVDHRWPQNDGLGKYRRDLAKMETIEFTADQQLLLLNACRCPRSSDPWHVHAAAVVSTHIHVIVSWHSDDSVEAMTARLKQHFTYLLSIDAGIVRGRWFSRGSGTNRIRDMAHLIELVRQYLPGHGENVWIEDRILSQF